MKNLDKQGENLYDKAMDFLRNIRIKFNLFLTERTSSLWKGHVDTELHSCVHKLVMLGHENGACQKEIDAAKDSLYRALILLEK